MREERRIPIVVPDIAMPKKDLENPCSCQDIPVKLKFKKGVITWLKDVGETVEFNEVICEGEVEKKSLEIVSPCKGVLVERLVDDDGLFGAGDTLGYIEENK